MDTKPTEVNAAEEMEEPEEIPTDHDQIGLQAPESSKSLDQDEQMAIG